MFLVAEMKRMAVNSLHCLRNKMYNKYMSKVVSLIVYNQVFMIINIMFVFYNYNSIAKFASSSWKIFFNLLYIIIIY